MNGKIKEFLETCVKEGVFPGAVWIIGTTDKTLEKGFTGVLGKGLEPAAQDSIYDLASLTKPFTALALLKQFEDGLLRLEDTVDYFLPNFKNIIVGKATVFSLMTHTSPVPGGISFWRYAKTRDDLIEAIRSGPARFASNERVEYCCGGYILLGEIISKIDAVSLDNVIQNRVLEPLGMKETCYKPGTDLVPRIAATSNCPLRKKISRGQVNDINAAVMGGISGNAGLFSTAGDLTHFAAAMLTSLEENAFLRKATAEMMIKNHTDGKGQNRGLGWVISGNWPRHTTDNKFGDLMSPRSFCHTGWTGTGLWIDPERKFYSLLLTNYVHSNNDINSINRARHIFNNLAVSEYGG